MHKDVKGGLAAAPFGREAVPDGVEEALALGLEAHLERPVRILELRSEPLDTFSMHPISRLRLVLDGGGQISVIFKRLQPQPDRDVRQTALKYRRLLTDKRLDAPTVYASVCDEPGQRYWVFLEDVGETMLSWCEVEDWVAAFRWLARMHAVYYGRENDLRGLGCLGEHGPAFYRFYARGAEQVARRHAGMARLARFERVMTRCFEPCVAYLSGQSRTLVHGDAYCTNFMVQPGPRIRPIDWEYAAIGVAGSDVAKLIAGWGADKPRFVAAYLEEFARHASVRLKPRAFARSIAHCELMRLLKALYWWGGPYDDPAFVDGVLDGMELACRHIESETLPEDLSV